MYQTVGHSGLRVLAQALDLPFFVRTINGTAVNQRGEYGSRKGKAKEVDTTTERGDETEDLYELLKSVKVRGSSSPQGGADTHEGTRLRFSRLLRRWAGLVQAAGSCNPSEEDDFRLRLISCFPIPPCRMPCRRYRACRSVQSCQTISESASSTCASSDTPHLPTRLSESLQRLITRSLQMRATRFDASRIPVGEIAAGTACRNDRCRYGERPSQGCRCRVGARGAVPTFSGSSFADASSWVSLQVKHLGQTLAQMQPTLHKLVRCDFARSN